MGTERLGANRAPNPSLFCLRVTVAPFRQVLGLIPPHALKVLHNPKTGRAQ